MKCSVFLRITCVAVICSSGMPSHQRASSYVAVSIQSLKSVKFIGSQNLGYHPHMANTALLVGVNPLRECRCAVYHCPHAFMASLSLVVISMRTVCLEAEF